MTDGPGGSSAATLLRRQTSICGRVGVVVEEASRWDAEYQRKGIPSSHRQKPSRAVQWLLHNWTFADGGPPPRHAIDVGCGTGRNTRWLAAQEISTLGLDWSAEALAQAQSVPAAGGATFRHGDIRDGLPREDGSVDLVVDTFVYFHQVDATERHRYLRELHRVLRPGGLLLMSLATAEDGFYRRCAIVEGPTNPAVVLDPVAQVSNLLFTEPQFITEISRRFKHVMTWRKTDRGLMHGDEYDRVTVAAIFRKDAPEKSQ